MLDPFPRKVGLSPLHCTDRQAAILTERSFAEMAERVGFEPTVGVSLHTLSKRAP